MSTVLSETPTIEVTTRTVQTSVTSSEQPLPVHHAFALARLLRMGEALYYSGEIRHAMFIFGKIMSDYPDSAEADQASGRLIEVAEHYERQGELRLAQSIYEELL